MKKEGIYYITIIIGVILLFIGVFIFKFNVLLLASGWILFCFGTDKILTKRREEKDPEFKKIRKVVLNDERRIYIENKAKAKAYDLMIYLIAGVLLIYSYISASIVEVLSIVAVYTIIIGYRMFLTYKYSVEE